MKIIGHGITSDEFSCTVMCGKCTCYYEASKDEQSGTEMMKCVMSLILTQNERGDNLW